MKRVIFFAFVAIVVISCQKEIDSFETKQVEFKAITENGTKTALSGLDVIWEDTDQIYLFRGTYKLSEAVLCSVKDGYAGSSSTIFVTDGPSPVYSSMSYTTAIYGSVIGDRGRGLPNVYLDLPSTRLYREKSFGQGDMPMVSVESTTSTNLRFKNLFGALELNFKGEGLIVSRITVTGNSSESLSGRASVDYSTGQVSFEDSSSAGTSVILDCGTGVTLDPDKATVFYITLPKVTFTNGITVEIETNEGVIRKSTTKSLSIARNAITPMMEMDLTSIISLKPLTFSSSGNNCISIERSNDHIVPPGIEYRIDKGDWQTYSFGIGINVSNEQTVSFRTSSSTSASYFSNGETTYLYFKNSGPGTLAVSGSVMSLISKNGKGDTIPRSYCFANLFSGLVSLTDASELLLPADKLAMYCYYSMFKDCSSLTKAPELPATQFASYDYNMMFMNCSSLIEAPELPAMTLSSGSYLSMFENCSSLTSMPELPALTVYANCYKAMFKGCINLVNISSLPGTTIYTGCYNEMFDGCVKLFMAPELPATQLASTCYRRMFANTAITRAPVLVATNLAYDCYREMFDGCSKLEYIKAYFTTTPSSSYTRNWTRGVSSIGTFVKSPSATWNVVGSNGIPSGWSIETTNEYIDNGTNYGPGILISGVIWAPVNCGYKASSATGKGYPYGKMYQWGRKAGFGFSLDYDESVPTTSGPWNGENGTENDGVFYHSILSYPSPTRYVEDWIVDGNDSFWNNGTATSPQKTTHDPCPAGWRVPTRGEMESLIENYSDYITYNGQGGRWFSGSNTYRESIENKIFLPAAGWLWSNDGGPSYRDEQPVLSMGNYWVSSTTTQYADHLSFTPSLTKIYSDYRAYGMSVRCVKE